MTTLKAQNWQNPEPWQVLYFLRPLLTFMHMTVSRGKLTFTRLAAYRSTFITRCHCGCLSLQSFAGRAGTTTWSLSCVRRVPWAATSPSPTAPPVTAVPWAPPLRHRAPSLVSSARVRPVAMMVKIGKASLHYFVVCLFVCKHSRQ